MKFLLVLFFSLTQLLSSLNSHSRFHHESFNHCLGKHPLLEQCKFCCDKHYYSDEEQCHQKCFEQHQYEYGGATYDCRDETDECLAVCQLKSTNASECKQCCSEKVEKNRSVKSNFVNVISFGIAGLTQKQKCRKKICNSSKFDDDEQKAHMQNKSKKRHKTRRQREKEEQVKKERKSEKMLVCYSDDTQDKNKDGIPDSLERLFYHICVYDETYQLSQYIQISRESSSDDLSELECKDFALKWTGKFWAHIAVNKDMMGSWDDWNLMLQAVFGGPISQPMHNLVETCAYIYTCSEWTGCWKHLERAQKACECSNTDECEEKCGSGFCEAEPLQKRGFKC